MRTHKYDYRAPEEEKYLQRHFSMTCEALGDLTWIRPVISVDYTDQQEPIYTRTTDYIEGFALYQATFDKKYMINKGWMQEDDELVPILIHIPVIYDYDTDPETYIDLQNEGHLIKIDAGIRDEEPESVWIATQTRYSDDMTHWIMSLVPYRADERDEVEIPVTGTNTYKFLKG